ncbi:MAG: thiamine-phosphate kinase [Thermodesulfobacteriota bacterium]
MELKDLGELDFITGLKEGFAETGPRIIKAIGDDTAVTVQDSASYLLTTTDTLTEGVHFSREYFDPFMLGRKALFVSLSDIAAMGGSPLFFLSSITLPASTEERFLRELYLGFKDAATEYNTPLVGGNTTSAPDAITLTTTVVGEVPKGEVVLRSGANEGDAIFVTGILGDSALGLRILSSGESAVGSEDVVSRHLAPAPRLRAGRLLAERGLATAMIDVSDGLVLDLKRLAYDSKVGVEVNVDSIPLSGFFREALAKEPELMELALSGGEDYELLFTAPAENRAALKEIAKETGVSITEIGRVVEKKRGISIFDKEGNPVKPRRDGYEHFK